MTQVCVVSSFWVSRRAIWILLVAIAVAVVGYYLQLPPAGAQIDDAFAIAQQSASRAAPSDQLLLDESAQPVIAPLNVVETSSIRLASHETALTVQQSGLYYAMQPVPWQVFAQGEYIGPQRLPHVLEYRLRVDDLLDFVYRLTREESVVPYELNVGDVVRVESVTDKELNRELNIQPDGTITLPLLGQVRAAGRTVDELRKSLDEAYERYYKVPSVTVTPIKQNTKLEDLRAAVDSRAGQGGQNRQARVTPEGTVQLPGIGSVPAQGLTLEELKREIDQRYATIVSGIEVTPVLVQRAPRHIYVAGEVVTPGRFVLEGPTSVMQAIALAGGWRNGGDLYNIVVFRRTDDWQLVATALDLRNAMFGKDLCAAQEIWLRDSDIVVVPPNRWRVTDYWIEQIFTRCIYGVLPLQSSVNFSSASTL